MDHLRARKIEEKEGRRQAILSAAIGLFESQGFAQTTIDQIALSCKLSRSLIYTYFVDKNHLFFALVSEALRLMHEEFVLSAKSASNGLERITAIGRAYVQFALSRPVYHELVSLFQFSQAQAVGQKTREQNLVAETLDLDLKQLLGRADQINQLMAKTIEGGITDGSIRPDAGDSMEVALSLWAITGGLIQTTKANKSSFAQAYKLSQDAIIARGLAIAYEGLKNKEAPL